MKRMYLIAHFWLLSAGWAHAAEHYILWGGGATPHSSQVSIESNVEWIGSILQRRAFSSGTTWFGSGNGGNPDVVFAGTETDMSRRLEPLARLFGELSRNTRGYRHHKVEGIGGPSSQAAIKAALQSLIGKLRKGDGAFLVYSGHGSVSRDPGANALRLWGETPLSAADLGEFMAAAAAGSSVRFILPQCFSGGFLQSVLDQYGRPSPPSGATRCGFVSVSERRESEGCTVGIEVSDYRDYATYLFAALEGRTRTGEPLTRDADADGNGAISLLEAHYYAYTEAQSTDVPRTTSEYFLERSRNWLTRWLPVRRLSQDNPYLGLARRIAERLGIESPSAVAAGAARNAADAEERRDSAAIADLEKQETALREELVRRFEMVWPQAQAPHTAGYVELVSDPVRLEAALAGIRAEPRYHELVALQDAIRRRQLDLLERQRAVAQLEKLERAFHLAAMYERLQTSGSAKARETLASLRACESFELPAVRQSR